MTKEQVLEVISQIDWQQESWMKSPEQEKIEQALGKYVVYNMSPDTYRGHSYKYYLTKEAALEDYEKRTTTELLYYCVIAEVDGEWRQQRSMSRKLNPWE